MAEFILGLILGWIGGAVMLQVRWEWMQRRRPCRRCRAPGSKA